MARGHRPRLDTVAQLVSRIQELPRLLEASDREVPVVFGVDTSPEMLAVAREKVPDVEFHEADLHNLPLRDDSVDLVVCAIALSHVPDLGPPLEEFVRVLRPNGHLVISDSGA